MIEKRLNDHAAVEASVMPHYRARPGLIKDVDARGTIDEIYQTVRALVKTCLD